MDNKGLLTSVAVQPPVANTFNFGSPVTVLKTPYYSVNTRTFDVSRDGQRFLMIKEAGPTGDQPAQPTIANNMVLVLNWTEELKARLPAK